MPAEQHRDAGNEHRHAPAPPCARAQADERAEQQRHHHLRDAAAEVSPAGCRRIRRADDVRREHHGGVILRHHERRSDHADGQAEDQERGVVVREADAPSPAASRGSAATCRPCAGRCGRTASPSAAGQDTASATEAMIEISGLRFGQMQFLRGSPASAARRRTIQKNTERTRSTTCGTRAWARWRNPPGECWWLCCECS